jgi:hypothetical protein
MYVNYIILFFLYILSSLKFSENSEATDIE